MRSYVDALTRAWHDLRNNIEVWNADHTDTISQYDSQTGTVAKPGSSTVNTFTWGDDARLATSTIDSDTGSTTDTPGVSTYSYDAGGKITQVAIAVTPGARTISYVTDAAGQVMSRSVANSNGSAGPKEYTYWFDGLQVGEVGNNGTLNVDYSTAIARRATTPPANGFRNGTTATPYADLDTSFERVNGASVATTGSKYTVHDGDTLQSIAQQVWGDSSMWYLIAEANGLDGTEPLIGGSALAIPPKAMNIHNTSETFKVYDPNKALGDTSPVKDFQPKPTGKKGCGIVGKIMLVAIAVAVAVVTSGAFLAAAGLADSVMAGMTAMATGAAGLGGVAAGAVGGALGSIVSQGVGVATGLQDKFSWKGVAMAAIAGGVAAGVAATHVTQALGIAAKGFGNVVAGGAVRSVLSNVATQGIEIATGLQDKFDWAGVAVAGVVGGVTAGAGDLMGIEYSSHSLLSYAEQTVAGLAGGIAGAATRSLLTGTDFGDNIMAVLPDVIGSTIGNMMANAVTDQKLEKSTTGRATSRRILDAVVTDRKKTQADIAAADQFADVLEEWSGSAPSKERAVAIETGLNQFLRTIATTPAEQRAVADYKALISGQHENASDTTEAAATGASDSDEPTIVVPGDPNAVDYAYSRSVDRAGIWAGEVKSEIEGHVGEFLEAHPGAAIALNVTSIALTVSGGPVRAGLGFVYDKVKDHISGWISDEYQDAGWDSNKASLGGAGITWGGSLVLNGLGALKSAPLAALQSKRGKGPGTSVLGHHPAYVELSEKTGAKRFDIPTRVWNKMSEAEQWAANQKFLDRLIRRGDEVLLATPLDKVKPGSSFEKELKYMSEHGYAVSEDGTRLLPPGD